jgi:DNA-binding NarL/FixJ family response regulator
VLKSLSITDLNAALNVIFDGGIYVPPLLANLPSAPLPSEMRAEESSSESALAGSPLTPRQQEVLDLLVQGKTNKEIALALRLGEGTVKIHMAAIFRYFGVNNRAAAAVAGARPYPNRKRSLLTGL